ncbi:MAG: hypothetical protein ACD_74C00008G0001 [uncultured bacterium]|nr:MAG: hypothetical protein ACD_74C00008G0001 [uncultured bacterium]
MLLHLLAHAFPCIAHHENHIPSRLDIVEIGEFVLLQNLFKAGNGQGSPLRHGVARVDGQIEQHLLDLVLIGKNPPLSAGRNLHRKIDARMDETPDHGAQPGDKITQVDNPHIHNLMPAEGKQLTGQGRASDAGLADGAQGVRQGVAVRQTPQIQFAVA